jgi:hypothetical protein
MKQADHYATLALALFGHDEVLAEQFVEFALANTGDNGRLTENGVDRALEFLANSPVVRGDFRIHKMREALANQRFVA